jgi:hypothetical protein
MQRAIILFGLFTAFAVAGWRVTPLHGQAAPTLEGIWSLDRSLSEFPREIGFNVFGTTLPDPGQNSGGGGGGDRGRRGSGGGGVRGASGPRPESYDDAQRRDALTTEARNPPARLTIVDTPTAITITNDLGQSRTFHPDLREETIQVDRASVPTTTTRQADHLIVSYHASLNREVRYTYSRSANPPQLIVEVQFLEHGSGDKARRVYTAGAAPSELPAPGSPAPSKSVPAGQTTASSESVDQRPGAELKGLNRLGVIVEDLGDQAVACGLNAGTIETAVTKQLTDAGFTVRKNSDEDSYVYVNVMTASVGSGTCLSRYDAFLYTHAATKLSYHDRPVLVQVLLMHRGGMGSSAAAAHPATIARGLENFIALFIGQIRSANQ